MNRDNGMNPKDKEVLLEKIEVTYRNLLELSEKLIREIDDIQTIHLELATKDDRGSRNE